MRLVKAVLAVFVLAAIVVPQVLYAQVTAPQTPTCLQQAAWKIRANGKITVLKQNGESLKGRLISIDLGQSHLTMRLLNTTDTTLMSIQQPEIAKIKYDKSRKLKPGFMALGLIGGALIGGLIGLAIEGDEEEQFPFFAESEIAVLGGAAIGGGVGLLAGTFIPLVPKTGTIECK
ncbi:MAG: hypothetical protein L0Z48_10885 [candidate division Zixibacteria bacterium]|nr:hypothetical protein [candidate division Zixibacteria bacterium]MCI0597028.1 hypothetical protein [candidate division Zixibacteria bacterium]